MSLSKPIPDADAEADTETDECEIELTFTTSSSLLLHVKREREEPDPDETDDEKELAVAQLKKRNRVTLNLTHGIWQDSFKITCVGLPEWLCFEGPTCVCQARRFFNGVWCRNPANRILLNSRFKVFPLLNHKRDTPCGRFVVCRFAPVESIDLQVELLVGELYSGALRHRVCGDVMGLIAAFAGLPCVEGHLIGVKAARTWPLGTRLRVWHQNGSVYVGQVPALGANAAVYFELKIFE